jgi:hypothetical protein
MTNNYAIIQNEVVINVAVADSQFAQEQGWVELTDGAGLGWGYINGQFVSPPEPDYSEQNKQEATALLQATDWVELPSVSNTSITPHLVNVNELISYRAAIRTIAVNPPNTPATFPDKPQEVWSN